MRNLLMISAAALALSACGPKANDPTPNVNTVATTTDTVAVPANDASVAGTNTSAIASATLTPDEFATKASMGDMYEIAAGKIAAKKATDPAVKAFANQMVEAHTATTRGLKAALAKDEVAVTPPAALDAEHQGLIDALNKASGSNFDELYKGQQRDAHNTALGVMQSYASSGAKPAIKAFAADTAPKVEGHIAMLKALN
jgi:putative membrane protein